jgi:hypothetical protein
VELIQVDAFDFKAAETPLDCLSQMLGPSVRNPGKAIGPQEATLGCNY